VFWSPAVNHVGIPVLWGFSWIFYIDNHVFCKKTVLFLPSQHIHLLFPFLVLLHYLGLFSIVLKRSGLGHPCSVPDLSRKVLNSSPLSNLLAVEGFLSLFLINLRKFPSVPSFLRIFIINECWILSNAFLHLLMWSCDFIFFNLLI
jgi:hypothetical protein